MIDLQGHEVSSEEKALLQHPMVGGVILFFKNCKNFSQLKRLVSEIRTLKPEIIIAVDREGGNLQRFQKAGFRCFPAARTYGDVYDLDPKSDFWIKYTTLYAEGIGEELNALGINLNLAPVLDPHSNSEIIGDLDRAFHVDRTVCAEIAKVFIDGLHQKNVKATGKHFPDHSVCESDSHTEKPICTLDRQTLLETHLLPYKMLIQNKKLDAIMPAHITYTTVDSTHPAGFSKIWLQDILRDQLGFTGVVISDCLSMVGADIGAMQKRAINALAEGCCDMTIMCNQTPELALSVLEYLTKKLPENVAAQSRLSTLGEPVYHAYTDKTIQLEKPTSLSLLDDLINTVRNQS